jgi:hypothetical protein
MFRTLALLLFLQPLLAQTDGETRVPVTFTGGHDTDPRDHGRPDVLIAAALNVPAEVFRKAFSGVTPAAGGRAPEPGQVDLNKRALLSVLKPYGVTNDRLDEVSNYYRYNRSQGQQVWRSSPASAYATIRGGVVTGITVTDPGAGYSSPPQARISLTPNVALTVSLAFGTVFEKNGSIREIGLVP